MELVRVPKRRLGRLPSPHDLRTLRLAKYLPSTLVPAPEVVDWSTKASKWGPMLNTDIGDCGIAAPGHAEQVWTSQNDNEVIISDDRILAAYEDVSGFQPSKPETDVGVNMLSVCKYWRTTGIGGKKIKAFASLDLGDWNHIEVGTYLFGGFYAGLALPISCQTQTDWEVDFGGTLGNPGRGSWGGHAIWVVGYDSKLKRIKFLSWGQVMTMSFNFWLTYGDEGYVCWSPSEWAQKQLAPSGVDMATLDADLFQVGQMAA